MKYYSCIARHIYYNWHTMAEVKLRKGQSVEVGIQKLRKLLDREGTLKKVKEKRFYEKPSRKKYLQQRKAKYIQRLRSKDEQW